MQKISLNSPEDMFAFGQKLADLHKIIFLQWELGAGKTTLIKWFASWLGIDPLRVSSPTYTYIQEYASGSDSVESKKLKVENINKSLDSSAMPQNDSGVKKLLHIDMYNIHSFDQLIEKWIAELLHDYAYIAIERPKFLNELGLEGAMITIEKGDGDMRYIVSG